MNQLQIHNNKLSIQGLPAGYTADIKIFNEWLAGRPLNREIICEYFDNMKAKGRKPATISRHRAALKKAFINMKGNLITEAERAQLREFFSQIKPGRPSVEKLRDDMLTPTEIKKMIKFAGLKTELLIRALYQTASRVSELINIRIDDCEIMETGVKVRIQHGKGNKERFAYLRLETFKAIKDAWKGRFYLFEHNQKPINRTSVYLLIRRAGKKINKKISPHIMRHSHATNKLDEGIPINAIAEYLGHASPETCVKFYCHQKPEMSTVLGNDGI